MGRHRPNALYMGECAIVYDPGNGVCAALFVYGNDGISDKRHSHGLWLQVRLLCHARDQAASIEVSKVTHNTAVVWVRPMAATQRFGAESITASSFRERRKGRTSTPTCLSEERQSPEGDSAARHAEGLCSKAMSAMPSPRPAPPTRP